MGTIVAFCLGNYISTFLGNYSNGLNFKGNYSVDMTTGRLLTGFSNGEKSCDECHRKVPKLVK